MSAMPVTVHHNVDKHRFEATVDGQLARADYQPHGNVLRVYHTEVPRALEGRGIAAAIVKALLAYARERELRVEPACTYVRSYMQRHPDSLALLPDGMRLDAHR
jgi:predicted GNAT family acetyltransferase